MPEANTTNETPAAVEQPKAAAQPVADETAELRAQLAKVLKHKEELEADLHKTRAKREEEAKKAKEAGDFAKLLDMERERATALEAQVKQYEPDAIIGRAAKERAAQAVEAAKADPNLPSYVKKAIEAARSPLDAADILAEFRAQAKQPLPTAPAVGAAPANTGGAKGLNDLTPAEILSLKPAELDSLLGAKKNGATAWSSLFFGK
jgi:hypothetical protein